MADKFTKGSDVTITVRLTDKITKKPFYLENFQAATGYLLNFDNVTYSAASGTINPDDKSEVSFFYARSVTLGLASGDSMDYQTDFDADNLRTRVVFTEKLTIGESLV